MGEVINFCLREKPKQPADPEMNLLKEFPPPTGKELERIEQECTFRSILARSPDAVKDTAKLGLKAIKHLKRSNDEARHRVEERQDAYRQIAANHPGIVDPSFLIVLANAVKETRRASRVLMRAKRLSRASNPPAA